VEREKEVGKIGLNWYLVIGEAGTELSLQFAFQESHKLTAVATPVEERKKSVGREESAQEPAETSQAADYPFAHDPPDRFEPQKRT